MNQIYNYWIRDRHLLIWTSASFLLFIAFGFLHMTPQAQHLYGYVGGALYITIASSSVALFNALSGKGSLKQAWLSLVLVPLTSAPFLFGIWANEYGGKVGEFTFINLVEFFRIFADDQTAIFITLMITGSLFAAAMIKIGSPLLDVLNAITAINMNAYLKISQPGGGDYEQETLTKRHKLEVILEKYGAKNPKVVKEQHTSVNQRYVVKVGSGTSESALQVRKHDIRRDYGSSAHAVKINSSRNISGALEIEFVGANIR